MARLITRTFGNRTFLDFPVGLNDNAFMFCRGTSELALVAPGDVPAARNIRALSAEQAEALEVAIAEEHDGVRLTLRAEQVWVSAR